MKIKEQRWQMGQGFGGGCWLEIRVRELKKDEQPPPDAVIVPDDTPVHDWRKEES